jgi:hypothetical protein
MADFNEAFNGKINNKTVVHTQDSIDHFFTQRKVTKYIDFLDTETMEMKNKKEDIMLNFIAINIPYYDIIIPENPVKIELKIYGNSTLKYSGIHECNEGFFPSTLLKLGQDKQLFVHVKFNNYSDDDLKEHKNYEYVSFIDVPKRFQVEPTISDNN